MSGEATPPTPCANTSPGRSICSRASSATGPSISIDSAREGPVPWPREHFISDARRKSVEIAQWFSVVGESQYREFVGALFIIKEIYQYVRNRTISLSAWPVAVLIDQELN